MRVPSTMPFWLDLTPLLSWQRKVETPRKVPPFYYEWAFDAILKNSGKTWNVKTIERIEKSWPHMEVFRRLAPNKFNLLAVKKVMES